MQTLVDNSTFCRHILMIIFFFLAKEIGETYPPWFVIGLIATVICLLMAFSVICFMLCKY